MSPIADNVTGGILHSCYAETNVPQRHICLSCAKVLRYYGIVEEDVPEDEYRWFFQYGTIDNQLYKPINFCPYCGEKLE